MAILSRIVPICLVKHFSQTIVNLYQCNFFHYVSSLYFSSPPPGLTQLRFRLLGSTLSGLAFASPVERGGQGETYFRPMNIAKAAKIPPKIKPWAK
jgi:hypothetical protein